MCYMKYERKTNKHSRRAAMAERSQAFVFFKLLT